MIQDQTPLGFALRVVCRFPKTTVLLPLLLFGVTLATGFPIVNVFRVNHVIDAKTIASLDAEVFIAGVTQSLTDGGCRTRTHSQCH